MGFKNGVYNFDEIKQTFGENLRKARKEKCKFKTQEAFAEAFGCNIESVRNWEQGRTVPETGTLFRLADFLDCDLDYLIGRIDKPTHDIKFISDELRLSEEAVEKLQRIASRDRANGLSETLSRFIMNDNFEYLLALMNTSIGGEIETGLPMRSHVSVAKQAVINNEARSIFDQIERDVVAKATPLTDERIHYGFVYGLHAEGKISDEQLQEIIEQYDSGNFEYSTPEILESIKSN